MTSRTHQKQVNIRLDDETLTRLDRLRAQFLDSSGSIPTRSDLVRMAIEEFLEKRSEGDKPQQ